jgi:hypothetical protein
MNYKSNFLSYLGMLGLEDKYGVIDSLFSDIVDHEENKRYPYEKLGDDYDLRPIDLKDDKGNDIPNTSKYCNLYLNGNKVSDKVFRKGGMCNGFKDGYCSLIYYTKEKTKSKRNNEGFNFGTHVIINALGEIKLKVDNSLDHPYHIGGHLASIRDYIYDLRTGKVITPKGSTTISGSDFIIIEHRYGWHNKEVTLPFGIYKLDFKTAEIIKLGDIK